MDEPIWFYKVGNDPGPYLYLNEAHYKLYRQYYPSIKAVKYDATMREVSK